MYSNTSGGEVKKIHIRTFFGSNIMNETQQNQVPFFVQIYILEPQGQIQTNLILLKAMKGCVKGFQICTNKG